MIRLLPIAISSSSVVAVGPNTSRATVFDLTTFFTVVSKPPVEVRPVDVFDFLVHQRGDRKVGRISGGESSLSARTIARRLSSVSGSYSYLLARGDTAMTMNPVPRGLSTRNKSGSRHTTRAPLVRAPRTLPTILSPRDVDGLRQGCRARASQAAMRCVSS